MISLKSLFSSFPQPIHFPCSCALPPSHCLSLSRCFSHPALLHSQSLKIKEIKHRYRVLACKLPWRKGETISLLYFINPLSLSLLLVLFLPAPEKTMLIVMMFCPPPALVHSLPPPASRINLLLFCRSPEGHKKRLFSQSLFYTSHLNH